MSVKYTLPFQRISTVKHKLSIFLHLLHIQVSKYIKDVIASTVTEAGEKFVKRYGYKLIYEQRQLEGFKIYIKLKYMTIAQRAAGH